MDLIASPSELSSIVGISARTIRKQIRDGRIKHVEQVGGRFLVNATREWPKLQLRRETCTK